MPLPWSQSEGSAGTETTSFPFFSSRGISPPKFDRVLNIETLDTKHFHHEMRRTAANMPSITSSKTQSDAIDKFCEEKTQVAHFPDESATEIPEMDTDVEKVLNEPRLINNLQRLNVKKFNAVQLKSIWAIREGRGVLVEAPTGIGKTYAFIIPTIEKVLEASRNSPSKSEKPAPYALILGNTTTLMKQTFGRIDLLLGLSCVDNLEPITEIKADMLVASHQFTKGRCDIACCTMGKLRATIEAGEISLENLKMIVIDEADKMVDTSAFGLDVDWMLDQLPDTVLKGLQACFFSATYVKSGEGHICLNALQEKMIGTNPWTVIVCPRMTGYIKQRVIRIGRQIGANISTQPTIVKMAKIISLIEKDLERTGKDEEGRFKETIVVFCETVARVTQVTEMLRLHGYNFKPMSRVISKPNQNVTLNELEFGKIHGIVCTNIMARGIDVSSVKHTIVMEMSNDFDTYKHRIGRVGRDGSGGIATVLIDDHQLRSGPSANIVEQLVVFLKQSNEDVPQWLEDWYKERNSEEYA